MKTDKQKTRGEQKKKDGIVLGNSMDKTLVVGIERKVRHKLYHKEIKRITKCYVHDPDNIGKVGEKVRIVETRPLSKNKRWRLVEVLQEKS
jgi:small subunit ribosomal protein S17